MFANGQSDFKGPKRVITEPATPIKPSGIQQGADSDSDSSHEKPMAQPKKRRADLVPPSNSRRSAGDTSGTSVVKKRSSESVPHKRRASKEPATRVAKKQKRGKSVKRSGHRDSPSKATIMLSSDGVDSATGTYVSSSFFAHLHFCFRRHRTGSGTSETGYAYTILVSFEFTF